MKEFASNKAGFGKADRFLYVKMARKLMACQDNVGPASYEHHDQFRKLAQSPCNTIMVSDSGVCLTPFHVYLENFGYSKGGADELYLHR